MSLPPALLKRLAQRGLVDPLQKPLQEYESSNVTSTEDEEVIAENYDEFDMENDNHQTASEEYQCPTEYDLNHETVRKRGEDNYWLTQIKARMVDGITENGYKCCPNKYNIWHKCSLYCINRWGEGIERPSSEYMRRYKRLLKKYPLPKGWVEMYDPGCGCYYFACEADGLVSWLPPTHPKSQLTKSAGTVRRQIDDSNEDNDNNEDQLQTSQHDDDDDVDDNDEMFNVLSRTKSPSNDNTIDNRDFPSLEESAKCPTVSLPRKPKSRDLDRALSKQKKDYNKFSERNDNDKEKHISRRHIRDKDNDILDPMDPSAYSDVPRGKWSDGLPTVEDSRKKKSKEEIPKSTDQDDVDDEY